MRVRISASKVAMFMVEASAERCMAWLRALSQTTVRNAHRTKGLGGISTQGDLFFLRIPEKLVTMPHSMT